MPIETKIGSPNLETHRIEAHPNELEKFRRKTEEFAFYSASDPSQISKPGEWQSNLTTIPDMNGQVREVTLKRNMETPGPQLKNISAIRTTTRISYLGEGGELVDMYTLRQESETTQVVNGSYSTFKTEMINSAGQPVTSHEIADAKRILNYLNK